MPFAPAILVSPGASLLVVSGCTASPLYHSHPHIPEEHILPNSMREQAHLVFKNLKMSLDAAGISWRHVVKVTRYLTDMRDQDELNEVQREYLGDHKPASTTVEVNHLVTPPARLEIELGAGVPAGEPVRPATRRRPSLPRGKRR
jgi:enamine deaminase RidA (YjgF/YER057c/UK114 family)